MWVTQNPVYKSQEVTGYNTDLNKGTELHRIAQNWGVPSNEIASV